VDVPLHVLRYFCVLADELHFGNAAKLLNISAPSLSQQISRLERMIDLQLFDRTPRKVVLTEAGLELLPLARRVRDDHDQVLRWARSKHANADSDLLRVGMVAAGAGALTTAILTSAVQRMPSVRFEMRRLGFFDTAEELNAGRVDVVFAPSPIDSDDRLRIEPLWTEPRVLVVPVTHPLAGRSSISIMETADEAFLGASGGNSAILDWWLVDPRPDGSHPRRGPVADDIEGLLELVAAGVGVNIASASAASHYRREEIAFIPIDDIEPATILLCSLASPTNPAVRIFESIAAELAPPLRRA
jgi:DNA-binding transcriptional LysR family regulator